MYALFVIRKARKNKTGLCPLNCRITIDGIKSNEFAVGVSVEPGLWSSKLQRLKGKSNTVKDINRRLDIVKSELEEVYLSHRSRGIYLSAAEVKDIYTGKSEVGISYNKLAEVYEVELRTRSRAKTTMIRYHRAFKYLGEYLKINMAAAAIERRHVSGFWVWLKSRNYHNDYCNKIVQACMGLFKYGIREGYFDKSPFAGVSLEWKKELDTTCLTSEEVDLIRTHSWDTRLQKIADSFLFMCYTGLHIGDYRGVLDTDRYFYDGQEFMKVRRVKTSVDAIFPLHDEAIRIIEKYGGVNKLPRISAQKSNDYLKLIASATGITKNLTNKIARKTFTDLCLNEYDFSPEVVATMLGHTSTRQIKHYGSIKEKRILSEWKGKFETEVA